METEAKNLFTATMEELVNSLSLFTEEELNTIPESGGWTIAQVGDHLLKSYGIVNLLKGEGIETDRDPAGKVSAIKQEFLYNTTKSNSPEGILPSTGEISREKLLEGIKQKIEEFQQVIVYMDLHMIVTGYELPVLGKLSRLEWIYFTSYHTQRHLQQIERIAANLGQLRRA